MLMTSVKDFKVMKERGEKISMLTVSDYTMACLFNASPVDSLLVGGQSGYGPSMDFPLRCMQRWI